MSDFNNENNQLFIFYTTDQAIIANPITPITGILPLQRLSQLPWIIKTSKSVL